MSEQKKEPKKLEDYEPGATEEQVMAALVKTTKPVKKKQSDNPGYTLYRRYSQGIDLV